MTMRFDSNCILYQNYIAGSANYFMSVISYDVWLGTRFPVAWTPWVYQERVFVNRTDIRQATPPVWILISDTTDKETKYSFTSFWWRKINTKYINYFKNKILEHYITYLNKNETN